VSADELREYLDEVTEKRPTLRLVAGINYKEGVSQSTLADWYAISRTTVHNWLDRLERLADEPFQNVIFDADRSGRPPKLTTDRWNELASVLDGSPTEIGIEAPHWSPRLVHILIDEKFNVEYSRRHLRELLNRAGLTWKTVRQQFAQVD